MTASGNPEPSANETPASYDATRIQVLEGLEAVRKRPGMYVGSTDGRGLHQLAYEAVDQAVEEVLAGQADTVDVTLTSDGGVRVADNGRGIPVDTAEPGGKPRVEHILTELGPGGRFSGGYAAARAGRAGLGAAVVNALSERLTVEVRRDGFRWTQEYRRGAPTGPLTRHEETTGTGTTLTLWADSGLFSTMEYSFDTLTHHMREVASLNPGLNLSLTDERPAHTEGDAAPRTVRFRSGQA
jgi:DNA gyrase subunit B